MKYLSFILLISSLIACQQEKAPKSGETSTTSSMNASQDNFEDIESLGKKDESCATEEDIKESFKPKPKETPKAFKLQGGDSGCSTDGVTH